MSDKLSSGVGAIPLCRISFRVALARVGIIPVFVKMYIYTKFFKKDPLFRVVFNVSRWFHAFFYSFRKFIFF